MKRKIMIEFETLFNDLPGSLAGSQKKIHCDTALGVYYGISSDGCLRLSFLSTTPAPKLESTKQLSIFQGRESEGIYWTCFDLKESKAKKVFFSFCTNLLDSLTSVNDESKALKLLKSRYAMWKSMFKKEFANKISREVTQGLFGELYFLKTVLSKELSFANCIRAWSGPDKTSKDFSIEGTWYEIKTIGANSVGIKISSVGQLSSNVPGHLIVIKAEKMSPEFRKEDSSIEVIFNYILEHIDDEEAEALFIGKIASYGIDISGDESMACKFDVKSMESFNVTKDFPKIDESYVRNLGVFDVSYSLLLNAIKDFKEE